MAWTKTLIFYCICLFLEVKNGHYSPNPLLIKKRNPYKPKKNKKEKKQIRAEDLLPRPPNKTFNYIQLIGTGSTVRILLSSSPPACTLGLSSLTWLPILHRSITAISFSSQCSVMYRTFQPARPVHNGDASPTCRQHLLVVFLSQSAWTSSR